MTPLREALDRTLLLMRDDIAGEATDNLLVERLTKTEIALIANDANLTSHSAQCAFVTAALLMARSGHRVYLVAPDVLLVGPQPPLLPGGLISSLVEIGRDLLPGVEFIVGRPSHLVDLAVFFGDAAAHVEATQSLFVSASPWTATLSPVPAGPWQRVEWPFGGIAAGCLVAAEAFKTAMRSLRLYARKQAYFDDLCAAMHDVTVKMAPASALQGHDVRQFDLVSAGAITHAALYSLSRILGLRGQARVIDDDISSLSNLNRYALLRRSQIPCLKVTELGVAKLNGLEILPINRRYEPATISELGVLAPSVLVGTDHIPSRWEIQKSNPEWLGIGATTHWSAMASFHHRGLACAQCLHPSDDPVDAPIPTVAFVSHWAGLLIAGYFVRHMAGEELSTSVQYTYFTPLRPETPWQSPVATRPNCPLRGTVPH